MTFQMYVNMTVLDIYRAKTSKPIKLVERSLLSARLIRDVIIPLCHQFIPFGRYCFVENVRVTGVLESAMVNVLNEWYDRVGRDFRSKPNAIGKLELKFNIPIILNLTVIVYIRTTPEVAHSRMLSRARGKEVTLSWSI